MGKPIEGLFYFVGELNSESTKLLEFVKSQKRHVYMTDNPDEIDQGSKQLGKAVVVFSDAKLAMTFLTDNNFSSQKVMPCLLIDKDGTYNAEVMKKFQKLNLNFYTPKLSTQLVKDIKDFYKQTIKVVKEDEVEFIVKSDE
jgi:hypothetical protein